jgi:hypothetical protein
MRGSKKVVEVMDHTGELRRLELRKPDPIDWEVMSLCWRDETISETSALTVPFGWPLLPSSGSCPAGRGLVRVCLNEDGTQRAHPDHQVPCPLERAKDST